MDGAKEEILLQKIEELVLDEDKIVTNAILCKELDISLKESEQLLKKYVCDQKISPGKISATFLICGKLKDGEYGIQIADEVCLKETKALYSSVTSEIVYSIQKSNEIDFNIIALADNIQSENSVSKAFKGTIVSDKCTERVIKTKVLPPLPPQKNFEKQKPSSFFKPVSKQSNVDAEKKVAETNLSKSEVETKNLNKKGSLSSFFSQASEKQKKGNVKIIKEDESPDEKDVVSPKRAKIEVDEKVEVIDNEQNKNVNGNLKKETNLNEHEQKSNNKKESKSKKTPKKESSKQKQDGKKRKRIVVDSDSDDDIFGRDDDNAQENLHSDEDKPEMPKSKEPVVPVPKNKRRKAVQKTYEDEDGYIVTRTEYILVSASEDEENTETTEIKKEKTKIIPKSEPKEEKKSQPAKTKKGKALAPNQTTLMNFFKKK